MTNHDEDRVRRALVRSVYELMLAWAEIDPSLHDFAFEPTAFTCQRHDYRLMFSVGRDGAVAQGEMRWKPTPDRDRAGLFAITRAGSDPPRFSFNGGEQFTFAEVSERIVREFLDRTAV